jgi:hypothetical protein
VQAPPRVDIPKSVVRCVVEGESKPVKHDHAFFKPAPPLLKCGAGLAGGKGKQIIELPSRAYSAQDGGRRAFRIKL